MELAPRKLVKGRLPVLARRRLLSSLAAALTLTLTASGNSIVGAPVASASRVPAPGVTVAGNDISWPQCPKGSGGYGLPGPTASATFVVIGLTDGGSFRANPCLARQVAAAKARHLWTAAYAISTYPSSSELARYGGTGSLTVRLARVGRVQATFNVTTMRRAGLRSPIVWVDVEPKQKSPWSTRATSNNAVIGGALSGYRLRGVRAGLYSYGKAWRPITGDRFMPGVPTWVPVGSKGRTEARRRCAMASFSGDKPWLVQWTDGVRDYNLTCPGVTGKAAGIGIHTPPIPGFMSSLFAST
jgi:hypothetical protein